MSETNGNGKVHITRKISPLQFCMNQDCKKYMSRSNRFRLWKLTVERDATGGISKKSRFQKADITLCPDCFSNRQLGKMLNLAGGIDVLPNRIVKMIGFK